MHVPHRPRLETTFAVGTPDLEKVGVEAIQLHPTETLQGEVAEPWHDVQPDVASVRFVGTRADPRLDRREPLLEAGAERLGGGLDVFAPADAPENLGEGVLGFLLGLEARVPPLPALADHGIATDVDDDGPGGAALADVQRVSRSASIVASWSTVY